LEAKAACGHDIAGASCEERSEYMKSLERTELRVVQAGLTTPEEVLRACGG
jgi:hypothetical protein